METFWGEPDGTYDDYSKPAHTPNGPGSGEGANGLQPRTQMGDLNLYSQPPTQTSMDLPFANPKPYWASDAPRSANTLLGRSGAPEPQFAQSHHYSPAQLLNPKAALQQPTPLVQPNRSSSNHSPAPQIMFQFDSPGGSNTNSPHAHLSSTPSSMYTGNNTPERNGCSPYANGNGAVGGMGNMIDRVHSVVDRSMVPQKRRKMADDREDKNKAEFNGGGKGGVLGQYMKEEFKKGREQASANGKAAAIVLDDDDGEVQIVADPGDMEVCYGRIEGAEIHAHRVPTPKEGVRAVSSGFWPQVKIQLRRRQNDRTIVVHAIDSTRNIIGCLDSTTALGLTPLLDSKFNIRTASRILTRQKRDGDYLPGTEVADMLKYSLDLNLYGPKKYGIQIGRHLSQKNLWLRTPLFVESGMELYNPHTIERPVQVRQLASYASRQQGPIRTTEEIRNDVLGMFDSLEKSDNLQEMNPNHRITTELLKHQKQGLSFMTTKEKPRTFSKDEKTNSSLWRLNFNARGEKSYFNIITGQEEKKSPPEVLGGILADMMGLGKTLSILSLITNNLDTTAQEWAKMSPEILADNRDLVPAKNGKTALPKVDQAPLLLNCKTTLLVSPLSTITNWEDQVKQHVKPNTLSYYIYHGSGRTKDVRKLAEYDLVITTYGSVASEFANRSKKKGGIYPLEEINWFRIVLDEAHMIREQSTQQSKAICRLQASRRWAVTGTPVQNRLEDLGALMTFLRVKPFDEKGGFAQYIMAPFKMCDPEILPKLRLLVDSITLRRLKDRIDLPPRHDQLVKLDFSPAERQVYDVFAKNAADKVKVIANQREKSLGGKSYVHVLQSILRLRLICAHGEDLLCDEDLEVMKGVNAASAIELDSDDEDDNRPALSAKQAYDMYTLMVETNADICSYCNGKVGVTGNNIEVDEEPKDKTIGHMTPCFHILCPACFEGYKMQMAQRAQGRPMADCTICLQHIKLSYFPLKPNGMEETGPKVKVKKEGRGKDKYLGPHTKTKALIADLLNSKTESEILHEQAPIKSVVFSGWTAHLDLIQIALEENHIKYCRLDGKMSRTQRGAAMDAFREDTSILVILVSITAGGLGLNLTAANKVYVMEPQYNPAAEAQAVDRVHRLGQKREVVTTRYIMNDSFEEKMLELQEKKKKLASISMDEQKGRLDKADAARKRMEDLRSLFK